MSRRVVRLERGGTRRAACLLTHGAVLGHLERCHLPLQRIVLLAQPLQLVAHVVEAHRPHPFQQVLRSHLQRAIRPVTSSLTGVGERFRTCHSPRNTGGCSGLTIGVNPA